VAPETFTENEQEELACSVAPDKLIVLEPAAALTVPPPQLPLMTLGVATGRPAGRVTEKSRAPADVGPAGEGFFRVKVRGSDWFGLMMLYLNCTLSTGWGVVTVRVAVEVLPSP
jgi:hypothetical protein